MRWRANISIILMLACSFSFRIDCCCIFVFLFPSPCSMNVFLSFRHYLLSMWSKHLLFVRNFLPFECCWHHIIAIVFKRCTFSIECSLCCVVWTRCLFKRRLCARLPMRAREEWQKSSYTPSSPFRIILREISYFVWTNIRNTYTEHTRTAHVLQMRKQTASTITITIDDGIDATMTMVKIYLFFSVVLCWQEKSFPRLLGWWFFPLLSTAMRFNDFLRLPSFCSFRKVKSWQKVIRCTCHVKSFDCDLWICCVSTTHRIFI